MLHISRKKLQDYVRKCVFTYTNASPHSVVSKKQILFLFIYICMLSSYESKSLYPYLPKESKKSMNNMQENEFTTIIMLWFWYNKRNSIKNIGRFYFKTNLFIHVMWVIQLVPYHIFPIYKPKFS